MASGAAFKATDKAIERIIHCQETLTRAVNKRRCAGTAGRRLRSI
jgi:hypothetical protein